MDWLTQVLSYDMVALILGVSAVLLSVKMVWKRLPRTRLLSTIGLVAWRLEYLFPLLLSVPGALWLPGLFDKQPMGLRFLEGFIAGWLTHWAAKMWKRVIVDKPASAQPSPPAVDGEV